ncbi:MAG: penicillin acylase family protein [Ferruginibacter sp.]|nr:penicillin acylase family protein [Ferruginibacter sp.]
MRLLPFISSTVVTVGLVYALSNSFGKVPAMGNLLSPQHGFWQNAENANENFSSNIKLLQMQGKASVYFDDKLVPHVFAEKDDDLYFVQGYLHAKFRLFQMDLQTKAAEGRASEIAGEKAILFDKEQRRIGMRYAAEKAEKEIAKNPEQKKMFDAYTQGINSYIENLKEKDYPIEYKILGIKPEKWSNIRTALLLKMMAKMLTYGTDKDLEATNTKAVLMPDELKMLYPQVPDSLQPIVPSGTPFGKPTIIPVKPANADSIYFSSKNKTTATLIDKPNPNNGSNNWVVSGSKTKTGSPILCNDPHLELSLPSIWYEMQLSSPNSNTYGVSLPGSPFIIIGYNDSIAWGVTNAQRDVKDYYDVKFKDNSKKEYWYNNSWVPTTQRIEEIKVKGGNTIYDTVAYTAFGPVTYDNSFKGFSDKIEEDKNLAINWTALEESNEAITFYKLNRAKNYTDYVDAIKTFQCPGQNFVFASKTGDIAIWQQGKFPARWEGQGLYIMPGNDSSYQWQGYIPQAENPHSFNPTQGYLVSANQRPVDATYPYFIPGTYITPRGIALNNILRGMSGVTPQDMITLQSNYFNVTAQDALPLLLKNLQTDKLTAKENEFVSMLSKWDLNATPNSKEQTIFQAWLDSVETCVWKDELSKIKPYAEWPTEQTTVELLLKDSTMKFIDDVNTTQKESLKDIVTKAYKLAAANCIELEAQNKLEWSKFKNPTVYHLLKDALLPFARQGLPVGGDGNIINAVTHSHGPSWRMVVSLTQQTEAYGIYPGGQNGNPGSKYYDNFVDDWAVGKPHALWMMKKDEAKDNRVKWTMEFGQ